MINRGYFRLSGATPARTYSARALDLVQRSVVIDMLGLLTLDWQKLRVWQKGAGDFDRAEFAKLKRSGINVFHPAVDFGDPNPRRAAHDCMTDWNTFLSKHNSDFLPILSASDIARVKVDGKVGVLLGMQNSDHFQSLSDVHYFHLLGQRVSQLTYNSKNSIGNGCTVRPDEGLTEFGRKVVAEMNLAGMAVDVSHSGDQTSLDACTVSTKPVLITHSNCRALVPAHPRCKTDETIRAVARTGGVMGITSIRSFVRSSGPTTLEDALRHFDHVARLVGVEHIGLGSDTDLDGRDHGNPARARFDIQGLNHPLRIYDLTQGLINRRYSDRSIELILGENFKRALGDIWQKSITPVTSPLNS
jgi:membrane dipeptidase